jgi:hypothetical protein
MAVAPYGASEAKRIWPGGHEREQSLEVGGHPPGGVEEEVRVIGRDPPDPGQVTDPGVSEDQPGVGVSTGELDGVEAEGGNPASGVDQDGQCALVSQGDEVTDGGMVERELLGARMKLDAPRPCGQGPLGLGNGILVRVDAAERNQAAVTAGGGLDHHVVGGAVALGLVHGEHEGAAGVGDLESGQKLLRGLLHPVRVVSPDVGVGVEELDARNLVEDDLGPRADHLDDAGGVHN